jgi:hypothetical protein
MSRLEFFSRPLVAFDATNKEHREHWYNFIQNNGWGRCPVRFIVPEAFGMDLPAMIERELMQYYVDREFRKPTPKDPPGRRVKSKRG